MQLTFFIPVLFYPFAFFATLSDDTLTKKTNTLANLGPVASAQYCKNVVGIINPKTNCNENYIFDRSLYLLKVDTLPQVKFWRDIMNLHEDSAIISLAHSRDFIQKVHIRDWNLKPDSVKKNFRDSIRCARNLDSSSRILVTTGKKFFYDFDKTSQNFQRGIHCFVENNVDPWYAQAILLIESPNKLQKSNVGAYGPFQLMKDVARMYGLKVNKSVDERADFDRSAFAASSLIKTICIPRARRMLDSLKISNYSEDELWFKLLVMHVYHAGAYNVQKALFACNPCEGNMALIYNLWRTQTARFKSASQNYTQLVLAAMLEMNDRTDVLTKDDFRNQVKDDLLKVGSNN
jgi:hypothetical protein